MNMRCRDCRLLLPMFAVPVCQSVCLSRGSIRLQCAKTAEQIKILFGANTPKGQRNIAIDDPYKEGKGDIILGPPCISGTAEATESACGAFDAAFAKLLWRRYFLDRI